MPGSRRTPTAARLAAATGLILGGGVVVPAHAATSAVRVGAFYFEDATRGDGQVVVTKGDRIRFTFEGNRAHTATVGGLFSSGIKNPGQTYTTPVLTKVGTFTLFCQVHGAPQHGTRLVIRAAASPKPQPTRARAAPSPTQRLTTRPSPSLTPSPSPSPSPSARATPTPPTPSSTLPAAVTTSSASASPTADSRVEPPDLAPAVALDEGGDWLVPTAIVLLAAALAIGAISLGRHRRTR